MSKQTELERVEEQLNNLLERLAKTGQKADAVIHEEPSSFKRMKEEVEVRNEIGIIVVQMSRLKRHFNRIKADLLSS